MIADGLAVTDFHVLSENHDIMHLDLTPPAQSGDDRDPARLHSWAAENVRGDSMR